VKKGKDFLPYKKIVKEVTIKGKNVGSGKEPGRNIVKW
jgi:hypothetical protein